MTIVEIVLLENFMELTIADLERPFSAVRMPIVISSKRLLINFSAAYCMSSLNVIDLFLDDKLISWPLDLAVA